jgi:hypothetical protein
MSKDVDAAMRTYGYDPNQVYGGGFTDPHPSASASQVFTTKDSGQREKFDSGMQRDTEGGKARFDLLVPKDVPYRAQLLTRFAELMERGARKYDARNWELATGQEELDRAKSSAFRHFMQWLCGETDEDHAAAVAFNLLVAETVKHKMNRPELPVTPGPGVHIQLCAEKDMAW